MDSFFSISLCRDRGIRLRFGGVLNRASLLLIVFTALLTIFASPISFAQDTTATILGNVTDPTGAEIPKRL